MPTYTIQTPEGRKLKIEAPDEGTAMRGAQDWSRQQKATPAQRDAVKRADRSDKARGGGKARALADSYSFGFSDELEGAKAAIGTGVQNALGRGPGYSAGDAYNATTAESRNRLNNYKQEDPAGYWANTIGGAVANPLNAVGGGIVAQGATRGGQVGRAAGVGAAFGATAGAGAGTDARSRAQGAAVGGAVGAAVGGGAQVAGNALAARAAQVAARPASPQRVLSGRGVQLTPGQMVGGAARRVEDAMQSVPIAGDAIRGARVRGIESFDEAAINATLDPIGGAMTPGVNVGRGGVQDATQQISQAYDAALAPVTIAPNPNFNRAIGEVVDNADLPPNEAEQLGAIVRNTIGSRFRQAIDGNTWKQIDSELAASIRSADTASQNTPSARYLRDALQAIRGAHHELLESANPAAFEAVRQADLATANLSRLRQASQYTGTSARDGVFTPADLNRAVQAGDSSAGNRQFATGQALMQDLTDPAMQVLPSTVPDSGTPLRSLVSGAALTGGGATIGVEPAVLIAGAALTGATAAAYSRPAIAALNAVYRASAPGQLEAGLAALAQQAAREPALVPVYQEIVASLGGQSRGQPTLNRPQQAAP